MIAGRACARWADIADRIALGEAVAAPEVAFLRRHEGACVACGQEARVYADLESLVAPERTDPAPDSRARPIEAPRRRVARYFAAGAAALGGVLAVAASASIYIGGRAPWSRKPTASSLPPPATVTLLEGEATVDAALSTAGAPLAVGATIETASGRACLRLEPGIRACLAPSTNVRAENLAGPARVLRLERGRVAVELEPQPPGSSFSIATGDGTVTAIGTAFSVELRIGSLPVARVLHGEVLLRAARGERRLHAHEMARFGEAAQALPAKDEDADRAVLCEGLPPGAKERARLTLDSAPEGALVRVDGSPVGATPLDLLVPPGEHLVAVEGSRAPASMDLRAGEHLAKAWVFASAPPTAALAPIRDPANSSANAPASPPQSASPKPAASAPGDSWSEAADRLLATGQAARARGDEAAAARAYRALLAVHPNSAEASAATLSLAEIELGRGADAEALALFDRYLTNDGPLVLEARYGRIRALEALGRSADAARERQGFLRDYAGSPQADALRAAAP